MPSIPQCGSKYSVSDPKVLCRELKGSLPRVKMNCQVGEMTERKKGEDDQRQYGIDRDPAR